MGFMRFMEFMGFRGFVEFKFTAGSRTASIAPICPARW
jgi:hypothetical protein